MPEGQGTRCSASSVGEYRRARIASLRSSNVGAAAFVTHHCSRTIRTLSTSNEPPRQMRHHRCSGYYTGGGAMKAREWLGRVGRMLRGIAIAAVVTGVLAYVVRWLRLHGDTEPPPWTWIVVVVVGAVLLLVQIVDAVVTSVRQALTDTPRAQAGGGQGPGGRWRKPSPDMRGEDGHP